MLLYLSSDLQASSKELFCFVEFHLTKLISLYGTVCQDETGAYGVSVMDNSKLLYSIVTVGIKIVNNIYDNKFFKYV